MLSAFTTTQLCVLLLVTGCARPTDLERRLVGAWSWTYTVRVGFPPDDKDGRTISDDEFDIVQAGTWRVEGDVLITEMDNKPLIETLQRLAPSEVPPFKRETKRQRIVSIDDRKMVFEDGSTLGRVHR
jgi:hypothetical protein